MPVNRTLFEERVEEMNRDVHVLWVRLDKTQKGSPEHETLLRNLASLMVLRATIESLDEDVREKTFTEEV